MFLTGCSTVGTVMGGANGHQITDDRRYTIPRVYSGTASDVAFLRVGGEDAGLVFFDLPFSAVADTIILPYTLVTQSKHGNLYTTDGRKNAIQPSSKPLTDEQRYFLSHLQ